MIQFKYMYIQKIEFVSLSQIAFKSKRLAHRIYTESR